MNAASPALRTVVGAIIVDSLERPTLLGAARRRDGGALDGYWEFPGGKVEPGETLEAALARELNEELSIRVRLGDEHSPRGAAAWPIGPSLELRLFFAEIVSGELAPGPVHDQITWVPVSELTQLRWLPSDAEAVGSLQRALTHHPPHA